MILKIVRGVTRTYLDSIFVSVTATLIVNRSNECGRKSKANLQLGMIRAIAYIYCTLKGDKKYGIK